MALAASVVVIALGFAYLLADRFGVRAWLRARVPTRVDGAPAQPVAAPERRPQGSRSSRAADGMRHVPPDPVRPSPDPTPLMGPEPAEISPPSSPGVVARARSSSEVELTWSPPADDRGAVGYEIVRDGDVIARVRHARRFTDRGLSAWSMHCYSVHSFDRSGRRSASPGVACLRTPDTSPPSVPAAFVADAVSHHEIMLAWRPSVDDGRVAGYELLRDGAVVATAVWSSGFVAGLSPSTEHCYALRAFDEAGNRSPPSAPACARTRDAAGARPHDVTSSVRRAQ